MTEQNLNIKPFADAASETFILSRSTIRLLARNSKNMKENDDEKDDVDQTICEYFKKKALAPSKVVEGQNDIVIPTVNAWQNQWAEGKFQIHEIVHKAELSFMHVSTASTRPSFSQTRSPYQFGTSSYIICNK